MQLRAGPGRPFGSGRPPPIVRVTVAIDPFCRDADVISPNLVGIVVVQTYLPAQLDDEGIRSAAEAAIADLGASSPKDMGKVMGVLSKQLSGQATGGRISQVVKELLNR